MKHALVFIATTPFAVNAFLRTHLLALAETHDVTVVAATNDLGRDTCAAYTMVPALLNCLVDKWVKKFDFGRIDSGNSGTEGMDHFKKGFGGSVVEYLGEWEFIPSDMARVGLNLGLLKIGGRI